MYQYTFVAGLNHGDAVMTVRTGQTFIPLNMENARCIQFLTDWKAGAEVLNADGSPAPYSDDAVRALGLEPV